MRKILSLCLLLILTSCVVRTTTTYIKTPPNGDPHKIDEKKEIIWICE